MNEDIIRKIEGYVNDLLVCEHRKLFYGVLKCIKEIALIRLTFDMDERKCLKCHSKKKLYVCYYSHLNTFIISGTWPNKIFIFCDQCKEPFYDKRGSETIQQAPWKNCLIQ